MKDKFKKYKNQLIVENHQLISFSPVFAKKISKTRLDAMRGDGEQNEENIFFPGCSLMSLGYDAVIELYDILLKMDPQMGISGFCCGKPSKHIWEGKKLSKRTEKIKKNHKAKIYTACPNCFKTLGDGGMDVVSIWPLIDEYFPQNKKNIYAGDHMMIHDPCTARHNVLDHEAVRSIMNKLGINVLEFENNKKNTLCCGKMNMTMALNPEKGMRILEKRVSQCTSPKVVSYCASCVHSFGMGGCQGMYVSELFLKKKKKPSWANRIRFVMKLPHIQD
ncbi:(Fe-S)-binding protein [Proteocatella sphenisci]|uniref:(Fe-S)-binding protein n=1 Tax=Proteocatella sphenisci TaxID=181070 RepID=UPI0004900070|nr:(Fe-S)-binding protein [Proteocatella sphenisci]